MTDPILVDIAAALAARSATSLYDLVRSAFARGGRDASALEAAIGAEPDSARVVHLAEELERAADDDPDFAASLRAEWDAARTRRTTVANTLHGSVSGTVIQAGDIRGNISFGR